MNIVVIGAGVVGLTSAWFLARDGHSVTVIDRAADVASGASFANGGQLSYSYVAPMAAADVPRNLPKWLLSRTSPVRFVPSADPAQWRWILGFLKACNVGRSALTTAQLLALSFHSRDRLHEMMLTLPLDFDHGANGKLVLHSSRAGLDAAARQVALQAAMGCEQHVLTAAETIALEPGLQSIAARLVGAIYTPSEEVGDCRKFCQSLARAMSTDEGGGVTLKLGCAVDRFVLEGGRARAVATNLGDIDADLFVLCAGAASRALARKVGVHVAVEPVRGYSISAQMRDGNQAPVRSITDTYRKTVYAPIGRRLRVAGFAEIAGGAAKPDGGHLTRRINSLQSELDAIFPELCETDDVQPWSGLRPLTPTGVPVIGRSRVENIWLNLGQGALGFTLSAGSASLLADLVAGRPPPIPAEPYGAIH